MSKDPTTAYARIYAAGYRAGQEAMREQAAAACEEVRRHYYGGYAATGASDCLDACRALPIGEDLG